MYLIQKDIFTNLDDLIELCGDMNANGKVVIDMLLSKGFGSGRFVELNFKNGWASNETTKVYDKVDKEYMDISYEFFKANPTIVDNSILPDAQKFLLKKGALISSAITEVE